MTDDPAAHDDPERRVFTAQALVELHNPNYGGSTERSVADLLVAVVGTRERAGQVARRALSPTLDRSHPGWMAVLIDAMRREWRPVDEAKAARTEVNLGGDSEITVWQDSREGRVVISSFNEVQADPTVMQDMPPHKAAEVVLALLRQPVMRSHHAAIARWLAEQAESATPSGA